MSEADVLDNFESASICHYTLGYKHSSVRVSHQSGGYNLVKVVLSRPCEDFYFVVSQLHPMFAGQADARGQTLQRIIVGRVKDPHDSDFADRPYEFIGASVHSGCDVYVHCKDQLPAGEYVIFAQRCWDIPGLPEEFTVRTYGAELAELAEVSDCKAYPFLDFVIRDELLYKMSDKI